MSVTLNSNIGEISGVGPNYAQKLSKLGIVTVRDLLFYFPRRWDDFSKITPIAKIKTGEAVSVRGTIGEIRTKKSHRGLTVTEAIITDETGTLKAVWFNQPFLERTLQRGDIVFLAGNLEFNYGQVAMTSPAYEKITENEGVENLRHVGRIVPVYAETEGISSKWLRSKIALLAKLVYSVHDYLPSWVKQKHDLPELAAAIRSMHFPETLDELKKAQKRFLYENLFCLFCAILSVKKVNDKHKAISIVYNEKVGKKFVKNLSFNLTDSQRKAAWEILKDISKTVPMNRLLEGDVGSGKTVVAAMAALMVSMRGFQTVIVAPTEILARQHFESIRELLEPFKIKITLLTGSTKKPERAEIEKSIKDGDIQVTVGTHALLTESVKYWTLALVVIDEQHRFGVEQRMLLKKANGESGTMPHFLSMSATPIPRTLALTVFGDLEISALTEMPPGRKKVSTHLVPPEKRNEGYKFINEKILEGRQVFVICPLISSSDKLGVKSAENEAKKLAEIFKNHKVGLLHGKLKGGEKEKVMTDFKSGEINILVSTSVIEVGVDIPNASIMVIEGAERFGLAQLHQFRGRVGRGGHQSWCFLFTDADNEKTLARLEALIKSENGFDLAEKDLALRGPGEFIGVKQHGKIDDTLVSAMKNPGIISDVKKTAAEFLAKNNLNNYPELYEKVADFGLAAKLE